MDPDLIAAIKEGSLAECKRLVEEEGEDVHETDKDGNSCIIWACGYRHKNIIKYLVSKGARVNDKDKDGNNCLTYLVGNSYMEDLVEFLVSNGAKINDKNRLGESPLAKALLRGQLGNVDYLLAEGADIHNIDCNGQTCFSRIRPVSFPFLGASGCKILYHLRKWPSCMAILCIQAAAPNQHFDFQTFIDLHQFLGRPDDCKPDNEDDYKKDKKGYLID